MLTVHETLYWNSRLIFIGFYNSLINICKQNIFWSFLEKELIPCKYLPWLTVFMLDHGWRLKTLKKLDHGHNLNIL